MKIVYWDFHGDEKYRICKHFSSINVEIESYIGNKPPIDGDIFLIHEGNPMKDMPFSLRNRCILTLTVMPNEYANYFKSLGYKYAILKNKKHIEAWGNGAFVLRPLCEPAPASSGTGDVISLISLYKERAEQNYNFAKQIDNIKLYGLGEGLLGIVDDREVISKAKFLVHVKHIGYTCNAVIKSLSQGVPILTDLKTLECGYDDLLVPNETCIASDDVNVLNKSINMSDKQYQYLRNNCLNLIDKLTTPDKLNANIIYNFMKKMNDK